MATTKKALAVLIPFAAFIGLVLAAHVVMYMYPSIGTIITETPALTLYIDDEPYANSTLLDWGNITRGPDETVIIYCNATALNTGAKPVTVYLIVTDEPPGVSHTWNPANGTLLVAGASVQSDLEITVTPAAIDGTYSMGTYYLYGDE